MALILRRAMGKLPYFVKRREKDGTVFNTVCGTVEHALDKALELRLEGHGEAWIEDGDGNVIDEKALKKK